MSLYIIAKGSLRKFRFLESYLCYFLVKIFRRKNKFISTSDFFFHKFARRIISEMKRSVTFGLRPVLDAKVSLKPTQTTRWRHWTKYTCKVMVWLGKKVLLKIEITVSSQWKCMKDCGSTRCCLFSVFIR